MGVFGCVWKDVVEVGEKVDRESGGREKGRRGRGSGNGEIPLTERVACVCGGGEDGVVDARSEVVMLHSRVT